MRAPILFALALALAAAGGFGWAVRGAVQPATSPRPAAVLSGVTPAALTAAPSMRGRGPACSWRT